MYLTISAEKVPILLTEWKFWLPLKTWSSIISRTTSSNSRVQKFRFLHAFHKFCLLPLPCPQRQACFEKIPLLLDRDGNPHPPCLPGRKMVAAWQRLSAKHETLYPHQWVHTSTNQYIPVHTGFKLYKNIPVHTSTYQYIQVHTSPYLYVPVCTSTYKYIPVCTGTY